MTLKLTRSQRLKTGTAETVSFTVPPSRQFEYRELVRKGQPDDRFDVTISTPTKRRTTGYKSQNHHLNSHVMQISQETGQDFESIKTFCKRAAIPRGLPLKMKDGDILLSILDGQPVPISETEMDTVQCGWCIEEVHILAGEFGIVLREE
jgi:hypothetical protein